MQTEVNSEEHRTRTWSSSTRTYVKMRSDYEIIKDFSHH